MKYENDQIGVLILEEEEAAKKRNAPIIISFI